MSRKVSVCMTLTPQTVALIEQAAPADIRGLSAKTDWMVKQWASTRDTLVFYRDEEQREAGTPDIMEQGAFRVMAWASYMKGFDTVPDAVQKHLPKGFRLRPASIPELLTVLKDAGYRAQLIQDKDNDITEVWAVEAGSVSCEVKCPYKAQLQKIREVLK